ncbi:MAG: hypothetical protein M3R31_08440 [Pseudomonadota bacterium]|nr:hypothetical protein [Pseudomonadota bacterium]
MTNEITGSKFDMQQRTAKDVREQPAYAVAEAAHYLSLPLATLRARMFGQLYRVANEERRFQPVIVPAHPQHRHLSFINLR